MKKLLAILLLCFAQAHAAQLTPVVVSGGSNASDPSGGHFFPTACDGNIYKLVEKQINAYVTAWQFIVASPAPAIDAWLYTDANQIIAGMHIIAGKHPTNGLNYWETKGNFAGDSMYVGKVWILIMCYPATTPVSIEPYAILYTRATP
tara:strand:- start:178 stop:621 length:444 start_codon:yes stop_codon:yes gene_type:complete